MEKIRVILHKYFPLSYLELPADKSVILIGGYIMAAIILGTVCDCLADVFLVGVLFFLLGWVIRLYFIIAIVIMAVRFVKDSI